MHQDDISFRLQTHFGILDSPFLSHKKPFEGILSRALALLLAQGKDPASPAIIQRLAAIEETHIPQTQESDLCDMPCGMPADPQIAAQLLDTSAFFTGLAKRPAFACSQFLQAVANEVLVPDVFAQCSAETVLETLLAIKGLGPDTAESMVLYAFNIPFIPVNTALYRIAHRHEKIPEVAEREEIRDWYFSFFPAETPAIRQLHSHLLAVGKEFCTSSKALCAGCPLKDML